MFLMKTLAKLLRQLVMLRASITASSISAGKANTSSKALHDLASTPAAFIQTSSYRVILRLLTPTLGRTARQAHRRKNVANSIWLSQSRQGQKRKPASKGYKHGQDSGGTIMLLECSRSSMVRSGTSFQYGHHGQPAG